ncbi:glycosyltransferase family 4 protein [Rhizosaccharibacter radicis]|uniref:Glycosyltransferase family 4 protein n=1 Tax=Rhizosaccharibacter radicis TaxID=2782605 RepID=A0ABT1VZU0_9PROT|nr:glycosyltransferase family 4 protein [Acetobacteraceae bacterium KSS12]
MKLAYVINSLEGGGAALPVPAVASVLRDEGFEVTVIALGRRDGRAEAPIRAAGFPVLVHEDAPGRHGAVLRWLDRAVARERPAVIWTSLTRATLLGQLVGWRRGIPVVSWQHAAFLKPANRRLLRLSRRLSRLWIGDSDTVTRLTGSRLRVPPDRLVCWPIFAADPSAPRARPWQPDQRLELGSLGRLHPVKGFDVLIEALRLLRDGGWRSPVPFRLSLLGDGPAGDALRAQARASGLHEDHGGPVRFAGYSAAPRDALAALHLYLQPSRSEGFCLAAHEAMQAALPVLASAVGELPRSVVDGETGRLVPPGDPRALADALAAMLSDPGRLAAMGADGRARVLERFDAQRFRDTGGEIARRVRAMARAGRGG